MGYILSGCDLIDDQTGEVIDAVQAAVLRALTKIGMNIENYAKGYCPKDTGNLQNSITYSVDGDTVVAGTNVEYAPYIELGTGKEFEPPPDWLEAHGAKGRGLDSWVYQDEQGVWHRGFPYRPQKFLQKAIQNHMEEYEEIIEKELQSIE